jgi:hypothetical protein
MVSFIMVKYVVGGDMPRKIANLKVSIDLLEEIR